jgi:hypothetical protein
VGGHVQGRQVANNVQTNQTHCDTGKPLNWSEAQPKLFDFSVYGAGDGNRTNPNEPNKGVTTRSAVQLESNGVNFLWLALRGPKIPQMEAA